MLTTRSLTKILFLYIKLLCSERAWQSIILPDIQLVRARQGIILPDI